MSVASVLAQVSAAVGFVKMVSPYREAWRRAKLDGVRLGNIPMWLRYMNGKDPKADKRCPVCSIVYDKLYPLPVAGKLVMMCDGCIEEYRGLENIP